MTLIIEKSFDLIKIIVWIKEKLGSLMQDGHCDYQNDYIEQTDDNRLVRILETRINEDIILWRLHTLE